MAKNEQVVIVKKHEKEYKGFDIRRLIPKDFVILSNILGLIFIILIIVLGIYAYGWSQSSDGQTTIGKAINLVSSAKTYINPSYWGARIQKIGNVWQTDTDTKSTKKGVIFNSFSASVDNVVQGSMIQVPFGLELKNVDVSVLPINLSCSLKDKDKKTIHGTIIPKNPLVAYGGAIDQSAYCRIEGKHTKGLKGKVEIEGRVGFPFETKGATLKVYFTTQKVKDLLDPYKKMKPDEFSSHFFKYYKIQEKQPISVKYKGEPVAVGMAARYSQRQPVILSQTENPIIGISIDNKWDGNMTQVNNFILYLPKGVTINQKISKNPNMDCPFIERRSGSKYVEYIVDSKIKDQITLGIAKSMAFTCWLNVEDGFVGTGNYLTQNYKVDFSYYYDIEPQKAVLTVKEVGAKK